MITVHADTDRRASLDRLAPDLFDGWNVLYVGANARRHDFAEDFAAAGFRVDVVEPWPANCCDLVGEADAGWMNALIEGDIRVVDLPGCYDVVFWWHGPEHIPASDLAATVARLEAVAARYLVLGSPWGAYPQGAIGGNPYEHHAATIEVEDLAGLGFDVECLGERDTRGSNLTAVKRIGRPIPAGGDRPGLTRPSV